MQPYRILVLLFWLTLPPAIVLLFEKTILFILTNVDQTKLDARIYGYLPYVSVIPPLTLYAISRSQMYRSRHTIFTLPKFRQLQQIFPLAVLLTLVSVLLFKGSFLFLRWCGVETPTFSNFGIEHHLFFSTIGALIPAVAEELYFRKFLFHKAVGLKPVLVIFLTALSFAAWHILSPAYLLHTFLLGIVFGYTYHKTQRIETVILAHTLANASAGLLILSGYL